MALPSGYTPLEYIESTGSQYVNIGYSPQSENVEYEFSWEEPTANSNCTLFGSTNTTSSTNKWTGTHYKPSATVLYSATGSTDGVARISGLTTGVVNYGKTVINNGSITRTQNGTTSTGTYSGSIQNGTNIGLFADIRTSDVIEKCQNLRLRYWRMKDNGVHVRDYIPCTNPSGEVGLYDDVNGVFYGDAAGVGFVAGPVAIYTELEYIESTGTQYVDTGLVVNKTDSYEYILDALLTNGTYGGANGYLQFEGSISGGKRVTIRVSYDGSTHVTTVYVDGVVSSTTDWTSSYNEENVKIGILRMGDAGNVWYTSDPQIGEVYSCQIKKNGSLVRDYVPDQRLDGTVGLLDKVNNVFYPDAAGGNFIPGPLAAKPEAPASLEVIGTTRNAAVLAWPGAPVGQSYRLYRDGVMVYEGSNLCYTDAGLAAGSAHAYSVHTLSGFTESEGVTTEATTTEDIVLITDRTASDVSAGRRKGYYNALDLIRVGEAMAYLEAQFNSVGISVSVSPKLDWQLSDIPTHTQAIRYLQDVGVLRGKLMEYRETVGLPDSLNALTWGQANDIESILLDTEKLIQDIILSYRHYSGRIISGVNALP